jgi:hypothetical protein
MKSFLMVLAVVTLSISFARGKESGESAGGSQLTARQALLNPSGFNVDWNCGGSSGRSHVTFGEDGEKIVIDINNYGRGSCKSEAKMTDSGIAWDGCKDTGIVMSFDASNKEIPFKGQSSRCSYEFNAR